MPDIIVASLIGSLFGILVGAMPGVNMTVAMVLSLPLLTQQPLELVLGFYLSVLVVCQYMGSVIALGIGVPGEANSVPALSERPNIQHTGNLGLAIKHTATGSLVGSIVSVALLLICWPLFKGLMYFWQTEVKVAVLTLIVLVLIFWSNNRILINGVLLLIGLSLGHMGVDPMTNESWVPFGIDWLSHGIPFLGVVIMIYALPLLWSGTAKSADVTAVSSKDRSASVLFPWPSAIRGSAVGFLAGFIPALSYSISSKIAWLVEKSRYSTTQDSDSIRRLVSAESANNAAALSALIPLVLFGIPLVASEVVLYNMLTAQGFHLGATAVDEHLIWSLAASFMIANLVGFLAAWPLARPVTDIVDCHQSKIRIMVTVILLGIFIHEGWSLMQGSIYAIVGLVLCGLGWMLRRYDTQPVIFGFIMSDFIAHTASLVMQKYSF